MLFFERGSSYCTLSWPLSMVFSAWGLTFSGHIAHWQPMFMSEQWTAKDSCSVKGLCGLLQLWLDLLAELVLNVKNSLVHWQHSHNNFFRNPLPEPSCRIARMHCCAGLPWFPRRSAGHLMPQTSWLQFWTRDSKSQFAWSRPSSRSLHKWQKLPTRTTMFLVGPKLDWMSWPAESPTRLRWIKPTCCDLC